MDRCCGTLDAKDAAHSTSAILGAVNAIPGVIDVEGPGFAYTDLGATEFATIGQLTINLIEAPNV